MNIALTGSWERARAFLQAKLRRVPEVTIVETYTGSSASAAHTVSHDHGAVPDIVTATLAADGRFWYTEDDRKLWSSTTITFRSNVTNKWVRLRLESLSYEAAAKSAKQEVVFAVSAEAKI